MKALTRPLIVASDDEPKPTWVERACNSFLVYNLPVVESHPR